MCTRQFVGAPILSPHVVNFARFGYNRTNLLAFYTYSHALKVGGSLDRGAFTKESAATESPWNSKSRKVPSRFWD